MPAQFYCHCFTQAKEDTLHHAPMLPNKIMVSCWNSQERLEQVDQLL